MEDAISTREHPTRANPARRRLDRTARRASEILAGICLSLGAVVLIGGWAFGIEVLKRIRPSFVAMVPSTAACFVLTGSALLLVLRGRTSALRAAIVLECMAAAIVLTNFILSGPGQFVAVEELLLSRWQQGDAMAVGTEITFLAATSCLAMNTIPRFWNERVYSITATTGLLVATMASLGYLFDSSDLYSTLFFDAMALHTSLGLLLIFLALILAQPTVGWMGLLLDRGSGSRRARRVFPIVVTTPLLLCLAALEMTRNGLFSENLRLAIVSIAMMSMSAIIALLNARRQNEVEYFARHDPLTGLPNRGLFYEALDSAIHQEGAGKVGLVLIDLDYFKQINDTMGHLAGDTVLRTVATRLRGSLRAEDTAARLGGDEFAAVLVGRTSSRDIARDAHSIHAALIGAIEVGERRLEPSVSVGVASFSLDGPGPEQLMSNADRALYQAKAGGRNGVRVYHAFAAEGIVADQIEPQSAAR